MPVNLLHSLFCGVESGLDPISPEYANEYDKLASGGIDARLVTRLDSLAGGLAGKRVLAEGPAVLILLC